MGEKYLVAGAQIDIQFADIAANQRRMEEVLRTTSQRGAILTVFPECALSGYCFEDLAEAMAVAQTVPGPATDHLAALCLELNCYVVFGLVEVKGDRCFNAAALVGPSGFMGSYRKIHLPYLGLDRFATPGDRPFQVWDLGPFRLGIHICYDGSFPESARIMAIDGADLIVLPTNWPPKSECAAAHMTNCRALENVIYYMAVDRVGEERGFRFIGGSRIAGPSGETLTDCPHTNEEIFYAEIEPEMSRRKRLIRIPGKHEIDRLADRRPEMYARLLDNVNRSDEVHPMGS